MTREEEYKRKMFVAFNKARDSRLNEKSREDAGKKFQYYSEKYQEERSPGVRKNKRDFSKTRKINGHEFLYLKTFISKKRAEEKKRIGKQKGWKMRILKRKIGKKEKFDVWYGV